MTEEKTIDARYRLLEQIGRGGQAVIYRALDTRMDREVALKVVYFPRRQNRDETEAILDRFRHEILVAGSIDHPNVLQVHDFGMDREQDAAYMVMQLLKGNTIKERLVADGPPPAGEALRIMRQLLKGLAFLHENDVIHRDLKPSNVFLNNSAPVIIDFGISSSGDKTVTMTGTGVSGSQQYICPELISPRTVEAYRRHARRDVWGLGMIGYELVTGTPYFHGAVDSGEIVGLLSNASEMLEDIGERMGDHPLAPLVLKILTSDSLRPEWEEELESLIEKVCPGEALPVWGREAERPRDTDEPLVPDPPVVPDPPEIPGPPVVPDPPEIPDPPTVPWLNDPPYSEPEPEPPPPPVVNDPRTSEQKLLSARYSGTWNSCVKCGNIVWWNDINCRFCGKLLPQPWLNQPEEEEAEEE